MNNWKKALRFALCLLPIGLIGGWFTAEMTLSSLDPAMAEEAVRQMGSPEAFKAAGTVAGALYTVICGFFGYILAEKIGLMRPFRFQKAILVRALLIAALCGAVFSLDAWTFAKWIPKLKDTYASAGSFDATVWIASFLYGGVTEEIMMRLFLMSLLALLGWKLFFRREEQVPVKVLIAANIIAALAFAAGHLPGTAQMFGELTPMLLLRCFLLNGVAGLLFGRFYRKYGIQYAILAHMLFHLVSRTIWLIAIP
jgi:hypothetical protein